MSNRYKGGVISATPPTTTGGESGTASGAWTLEQQMQLRAAGLWPLQPTGPYIEEVFSTYLYTGSNSTQTITNGIDLSTYGGLVWTKVRTTTYDHFLTDTVRGGNQQLSSNNSGASITSSPAEISSFNTTGYTLAGGTVENVAGQNFVGWTFRKQPKFFDCGTYTGNGTAGRTVSHNLGSTPGFILVKRTDTGGSTGQNWAVWHRSASGTGYFNSTNALDSSFPNSIFWGDGSNYVAPTSTTFTVTTSQNVNASGGTYMYYVFAHDAGGFGLTGTDNVISCGSVDTGASGTSGTANLGWEPQYVIVKRANGIENWMQFDNMRGLGVLYAANKLNPNTSGAEQGPGADEIQISSTGLTIANVGNNAQFIYIAIRRGPMRTPTTGTSVFTTDTGTNGTTNGIVPVGFRPDMSMTAYRSLGGVGVINDRLRRYGTSGGAGQTPVLQTSSTDAESGWASSNAYFYNAWNTTITRGSNGANPGGAGIVTWFFQRAPSVFDEVCYTGTGAGDNPRTFTHNLQVVPELMIIKRRNSTAPWIVYSASQGASKYATLNTTDAFATADEYLFNNTSPTASVFTVGSPNGASSYVNASGGTYVNYLFATCAGVSKVGSYTGTAALLTVDCGFAAGARFVLIKRTDSTGDWYTYDSARGITSSNDPYLLLNSSAAEVTGTNYVDTDTTGFKVTAAAPAGLNASGGTYIFLAIA